MLWEGQAECQFPSQKPQGSQLSSMGVLSSLQLVRQRKKGGGSGVVATKGASSPHQVLFQVLACCYFEMAGEGVIRRWRSKEETHVKNGGEVDMLSSSHRWQQCTRSLAFPAACRHHSFSAFCEPVFHSPTWTQRILVRKAEIDKQASKHRVTIKGSCGSLLMVCVATCIDFPNIQYCWGHCDLRVHPTSPSVFSLAALCNG